MDLELTRMKAKEATDGTMVYIDPGTRKTKKNRYRHIKEGTPKKLRGAVKPPATVFED